MSRLESLVEHHFDDMDQQHQAATLGMWAFLATEVLFFGALFLGYTAYRGVYRSSFARAAEHLQFWLGTFNTAVLLSSSLTMAMAVHAAQTGRQKSLIQYLAATIGLGTVFLAIKAIEYRHEWVEQLVPGSQFHLDTPDARRIEMFFVFYFIMTGLHAVHMIVGIAVIAVLIMLARRGRFPAEYHAPVEMTGLYWHFVDIVWIFLYPTFYLIGRHG